MSNPTPVDSNDDANANPLDSNREGGPSSHREGSIRAWMTVAGSWMMLFCTFGYAVNSFGVYQSVYSTSLLAQDSSARISWIGSTVLLLQNFIGLFAGRLFDRRYFSSLLIIGTLLYSTCLFMLSLAHSGQYYQIFLAQGVGPGLALGLIFVPSVGVVSHYFRARKTFAMGIVISGSSCGGIVFPILLNHLLPKIGFTWTVRTTAFVVLALMGLATTIMRPQYSVLVERQIDTEQPQKEHVSEPTGGDAVHRMKFLKHFAPSPLTTMSFRALLFDHAYWLSVAALFFLNWGTYFPLFYIQEFAQSRGISPGFLIYVLPAINAASFFGRVLPNYFADKWGKNGALKCLIPCATLSSALVVSLLGVHTSAAVLIFALLFGFVSGAMLSLSPAIFARFAPDASQIGFRMGLGFFVAGFGGLTGNPINGTLLGPELTWYKPIAFSSVSLLAGSVLLCLAQITSVKRM